ncbi:hypothetical protein SNE25_08630 [Mucilaginibacter sabulilitoris]|uniref:NHL repeat-containing protein n=1 Tax=Mucilaginibacter sabulilitoris TaxID=1173583 RepID=A0ABZ0TSZ8_9SPHI|nr:hypothetical protein [Mucilaginibacter sabulilitoris]WPU95587.1 hypothetical protein SNE25_08630 [Mucilaginibacter sabulilitoris]
MKRKLAFVAALAMMTFLSNCKKIEEPKPELSAVSDNVLLAVNSTANKVVTIAGAANLPGFTDGPGGTARFNTPEGIQLLKDGSLYVADRFNNAIRKIAANGTVSTVMLKPDSNNLEIRQPEYVGEDDKKSMHIICAENSDLDGYSESWVYNANHDVVARASGTYTEEASLAKDPYQDFFWFSRGYQIARHISTAPYAIGVAPYYSENKLFPPLTERGSSFQGLFVGRNKVIYFSNKGRLFKHTPSGVDAQIHKDLSLGSITSIVLNADCQTIYLAADGYIESIANGKLTRLAGPNSANPDGRDGVGFKADVHAFSLALGDHENTLYFSDTKTHTIRKLMLK